MVDVPLITDLAAANFALATEPGNVISNETEFTCGIAGRDVANTIEENLIDGAAHMQVSIARSWGYFLQECKGSRICDALMESREGIEIVMRVRSARVESALSEARRGGCGAEQKTAMLISGRKTIKKLSYGAYLGLPSMPRYRTRDTILRGISDEGANGSWAGMPVRNPVVLSRM